jgi:hypothetical protein
MSILLAAGGRSYRSLSDERSEESKRRMSRAGVSSSLRAPASVVLSRA